MADQLIVDYSNLICATPPTKKLALTPAPKPLSAPPKTAAPVRKTPTPPQAPQTIATMSADLVRDAKGNEHFQARMRDHTGVHKVDQDFPTSGAVTTPDPPLNPVTKPKDQEKEERRARREQGKLEKEAERERRREPIYKPLGGGGLPPPKSEREHRHPLPRVRS